MPQFVLQATLDPEVVSSTVTMDFTEEDLEEVVYKLEDFLLACGFRLNGELGVRGGLGLSQAALEAECFCLKCREGR